jgi:hypothetical protein
MIIFENHALLSIFLSLNIIPLCSVAKTFDNGNNSVNLDGMINICKWVV